MHSSGQLAILHMNFEVNPLASQLALAINCATKHKVEAPNLHNPKAA